MKRLYKFQFDFGRGCEGNGLFWSSPERIKKILGQTVNFGEVCGKHSEVEFDLDESMFTDITDEINNPNFSFGLTPLDYLPQFDYILLPDGTELTLSDLQDYNDEAFLIVNNKESYYRFFDYEDTQYEVIGSKEENESMYFLTEEVK